MKIKDIYKRLNELIPFELQEDWDNSGILIDTDKDCKKLLICLDVTNEVVKLAVENKIDLIISHHPLIFKPIKFVSCDQIIYKLIVNQIGLISMHTNFDKIDNGTSFLLAEHLNLGAFSSLQPFGGKISLDEKMDVLTLGGICKKYFKSAQIVNANKPIKDIFVLAGSASGMVKEIANSGCQCLLCGESKYHDLLDLKELGISAVLFGHDASENISLNYLKKLLADKFSETFTVQVYLSATLLQNI